MSDRWRMWGCWCRGALRTMDARPTSCSSKPGDLLCQGKRSSFLLAGLCGLPESRVARMTTGRQSSHLMPAALVRNYYQICSWMTIVSGIVIRQITAIINPACFISKMRPSAAAELCPTLDQILSRKGSACPNSWAAQYWPALQAPSTATLDCTN